MKRCPTCRSTYTNDELRYCLQDGATLVPVSGSRGPTSHDPVETMQRDAVGRERDEPPPTEILDPSAVPTVYPHRPVLTTPQQSRPTELGAEDFTRAPEKPARNALVFPLTVAVAVHVLALGGLVTWLVLSNQSKNAADSVNRNGNKPAQTPSGSNRAAQANANSATAASPSPASTLSAAEAATVRNEVTETLQGWAQSSMGRDLDAQMSYYADTLDVYYTQRDVSASRVREDRQRAYENYSTLNIELSNIRVTPEATKERAGAVFDKTWAFEGEGRATSGSVQQQLWLSKIAGRWRITGEKDLQVYYVNK